MGNENKTLTDKVKESVNKDVTVAKKASTAVIEGAEIFAEAVADHISGVLNGEKLDLEKEKDRAVKTIDAMVEKADEYYGTIVDRVVEKFE